MALTDVLCRRCGCTLSGGHKAIGICSWCLVELQKELTVDIPTPKYGEIK